MPAIQLARLRQQAAQVAALFNQPTTLVSRLSDVFEFYADRTHRPGKSSSPAPVMRAYRVPEPVLKTVLAELAMRAQKEPALALEVADALWAQAVLESRLLAAGLLGEIPFTEPSGILERLQAWALQMEDDRVIESLAGPSLNALRLHAPERFFALVETWLSSEKPAEQKAGVSALLALLRDTPYDNLPALFRLAGPRMHDSRSELRPYLLELLEAFAARSPRETAYFLRELVATKNPTPAWLARRGLDAFPPELQTGLRAALRG